MYIGGYVVLEWSARLGSGGYEIELRFSQDQHIPQIWADTSKEPRK